MNWSRNGENKSQNNIISNSSDMEKKSNFKEKTGITEKNFVVFM